jgi:hypothetical protein
MFGVNSGSTRHFQQSAGKLLFEGIVGKKACSFLISCTTGQQGRETYDGEVKAEMRKLSSGFFFAEIEQSL